MGTSTIFRRYNDLGRYLASMSKEDLEKIDKLSPWKEEKESVGGWSILMELHNGNMHPLVWWYGRLIHLRDAPKILTKKYYDTYRGKHLQASEWTLFKRYLEGELKALDKEYKRERARQYKKKNQSYD
ncbi:hypothetical protein HZC07_04685 [Candidatus Micrarchaeota archaeon]|nr:hypothetical protein [Candidatus Micrarchaeota archaeon]